MYKVDGNVHPHRYPDSRSVVLHSLRHTWLTKRKAGTSDTTGGLRDDLSCREAPHRLLGLPSSVPDPVGVHRFAGRTGPHSYTWWRILSSDDSIVPSSRPRNVHKTHRSGYISLINNVPDTLYIDLNTLYIRFDIRVKSYYVLFIRTFDSFTYVTVRFISQVKN